MTVWQIPSSWIGLAPGAPLDERLLDRDRSLAEEVLSNAAAEVPEDVQLETRLLQGSPADEILGELRDHDYDLVVLGSRGRGAVSSALLGSVSHHVLHHGSVPTLIVRGDSDRGGMTA